MPLIQVRVIKDVFTKEQKKQIISKLTDAMVSIEGENMRQVTWCVVEEVESGDWGIAGNPLTTADVHALARGKVCPAHVGIRISRESGCPLRMGVSRRRLDETAGLSPWIVPMGERTGVGFRSPWTASSICASVDALSELRVARKRACSEEPKCSA